MMNSLRYAALGLLGTVLIACGATGGPVDEDPVVETSTPTVIVTETPAPAVEPSATTPVDPVATGTVDESVDPTSLPPAERALALVAEEAGVPVEEIEIVSQQDVVWRDSALGCPQPDGNYLQVLTPGIQIIVEAAGKTYYIHGDRDGRELFICDNPSEPLNPEAREVPEEPTLLVTPAAVVGSSPTATPARIVVTIAATPTREESTTMAPTSTPASDQSGAAESASLGQQAIQLVAQETGLSPESLTVVEQQDVVWRDSALGCPQPGMNYLQVLTPGYRILVQSGSDTYHVHTNGRGTMVLCTNPSEPLGGSADQ